MATAASSLDSADPKVVEIDMEPSDMEPSQHAEDDETEPLHRATDADENIDYVLVYERCPEEEEKDKQRAKDLQTMRENFEKSLEDAGLKLTYPDPIPEKRQLVSSWLFLVKNKQTNKQTNKNCLSF